MNNINETSFSGLAHIAFHPDILIKLGKYFFESHPAIFATYSIRSTRFNLSNDVYRALGEIVVIGLRGEVSYSLSGQMVAKLNSEVHYFMNLQSYDDTCNNNLLNSYKISYEALLLKEDKIPPLRYDLLIYNYFSEVFFGSKKEQLSRILLKLIYDAEVFERIKNFSLEDSSSLSKLVTLIVVANYSKMAESQPNVMALELPKGVFYICTKFVMALYEAKLLSEREVSDILPVFLSYSQPSKMVEGLIALCNKIIAKKIGKLNPDLIQKWQQQYEQVFAQLITNSPMASSELKNILKINDQVQAFWTIKVNAEASIRELDRFIVSKTTHPFEGAKCLSLLKAFSAFFKQNSVAMEGFPQAIASLCTIFSKKIDAKTSQLFASCLEFKKQSTSQTNILLNKFQAFESKVFIDLADDKYFVWRDLVQELQLRKQNSDLINSELRHKCWLVLKACTLRIKLYTQYSARIASIITGFEQCLSEMAAWTAKIKDCAVVRDYFKYSLSNCETILVEMHSIRSKCEVLQRSIEDIIEDIGGFIEKERPAALSQFFLQHNLNKSLLGNCKQETTKEISFAAEKIASTVMSSK